MILLTLFKKEFTLISAAVILITCVFNFVMSPLVLCLLDDDCSGGTYRPGRRMYSRTIAVACFLSLSTLLCKYRTTMPVYEKNIEAYEVYSPTTDAERRNRSLFHLCLTVSYLSVILPINVARLSLLYRSDSGTVVLVFFAFMYLENVGMSAIETRFIVHCRTLDNKFFKINRDLERLGREIAVHPSMSIFEPSVVSAAGHRVVYVDDFYGTNDHSIANAMEIIRIRHRLIRDAVYLLIDLFGIPMGLSLFTLSVMTLFDIYYQVYSVMGAGSRSLIFIYMWLLQYSIRFYIIVVAAHSTTKQALKSKILITDINNRYLDDNTKEELQLFLNQISSCTIEFTAYDFFTLNTHLITSAIAAGTTYLVILLQFNSLKE